jgi:tetratricopeptide (TPR) repeat protein
VATVAGVGGLICLCLEARAALPGWMQDVVGASTIEAALYRAMEIPGVKALYPRPPKEAVGELSGLIAKAGKDAALYSLRAMEEEQALDFPAAEADWKAYVPRAGDGLGAKLELADYYHRRLQPADEARVLLEVGSAPAQANEAYTAASEQRSWQALERLLVLIQDQALGNEWTARTYAAWIARYPKEGSLYAREFQWMLETKQYDAAAGLISHYRKAFPQEEVFPLKAQALLEYRRGSLDQALKTYDAGFAPLWPAELVQSYYALLAETHQRRRFLADARARLAANPDDLNAMARLFYAAQQQGNLLAAQQSVEAYRLSKESRKANWSVQELYTLASLMEAIQAYPEAARYDFALYHSTGTLANGANAQAEGLSGMIRILLNAPDQPIQLGAGNLTMYEDIATLDQGPGFWNGILSLWLNNAHPDMAYSEENRRAQPYFHRAKAAELLAVLDKQFPNAPARAGLHVELIHALAGYGESALVLKQGKEFLAAFPAPKYESERVAVAMEMADAYARQQDTQGEFALYDEFLTELGGMSGGMPLTAAAAASHVAAAVPERVQRPVGGADPSSAADQDAGAQDAGMGAAKKAENSRAFEISPGAVSGVSAPGAREYQDLLERTLGRLTASGKQPQALAVLRKELDRNGNDPLLYERLATFLQQNDLTAQEEEVYQTALRKFEDKSWYDKLARFYLRTHRRQAFADLTKKVTDIFHGTELEEWFGKVGSGDNQGGPRLYVQLNLYAHQRFPHDRVFVENLLEAYRPHTATADPVAWERLMREHWSESPDLRAQFFDFLSRSGKLDVELAGLQKLVPGAAEQKANPAATREMAEIDLWRAHYEESAPLLGSLAEAYPADEEIGTQASSVFRSLAYFDPARTRQAVAVEEHLLAAHPADTDRLARIGDIYADSGADGVSGHEDIAAAAPYWRRMPAIRPGSPDGYLQAATIFWDYFQFDDAMGEIRQAREQFAQPALYGYEAGAIDEGKREMAGAIHEYTLAATSGGKTAGTIGHPDDGDAARRLLQLARRKATAKLVDEETARAVDVRASTAGPGMAAIQLRARVLEVTKRQKEIGPLLESALGKARDLDDVQAIAEIAEARSLDGVYEHALEREIALADDPVEKIQRSYDLARAYESRKSPDGTDDGIGQAARVMERVYAENPKILGVVRATTDFYWRNHQQAKAIATLLAAAKAAHPELSRELTVEAAAKSNESGQYAQARSLMAPLLVAGPAPDHDPYNAQYLAVVADSYARAGDFAALKQFYLDKLAAIRAAGVNAAGPVLSADERKQKIVLLRRGLIPALTRLKDYAGAEEQYIAILSAYPEDAGTVQEAALYAIRYDRQQQLVDFAAGTVKASPKDSRFALMLAQFETTFGHYPEAIEAYAHAITIRADRQDVFIAKADLEEHLQRLDDAVQEYERLYVLSYQDPSWMVKEAAARARQGRTEDAVKALQRAWLQKADGRPPLAPAYFRVATQLEEWNLLPEALHYAELGVKAEGDNLLAGAGPDDRNADEPGGAQIYARLMTRTRQQEKALTVLDAALQAARQSPNSPGLIAEQVARSGLASVSDEEWRKRRVNERVRTADQRYRDVVLEIGKAAGIYFAPEEKQTFAEQVKARWKQWYTTPKSSDFAQVGLPWIEAAHAAGLMDVEESLRKEVVLGHVPVKVDRNADLAAYEQLERSRMEYADLAATLEAYALTLNPRERVGPRLEEAKAFREIGDDRAELRTWRQVAQMGGYRDDRYLELLLKYDPAAFAAFGANSQAATREDDLPFAAPNYSLAHSDVRMTRASLSARAAGFDPVWQTGWSALSGLYFRDRGPATDAAFLNTLGGDKTVGERLAASKAEGKTAGSGDDTSGVDRSRQLAGGVWFSYAMRYGVYRTLAEAKEWAQHDPEDFLAAGLERNPGSAANYIALARAYADAGKTAAALAEYRHALELAPDSAAVRDAMAMLLWRSGKHDAAIAQWREAFAALNRIQDKGPAPESLWTSFALIAHHLSELKTAAALHGEMESLLRSYLARNGNYRSNELLHAAFEASETPAAGVAWVLTLSAAASDPAGILSDLDNAAWLPRAEREPLYLREIELARLAAAHAGRGESYLADRPDELERSLLKFYLGEKQDAKAEALLEKLEASSAQASPTEDDQDVGYQAYQSGLHRDVLLRARITLAARGHRLAEFLAHAPAPSDRELNDSFYGARRRGAQAYREAAAALTAENDFAGALLLWQFVFDDAERNHSLLASGFLGLAEAQIQAGDVPAAVETLRRLSLLPGDVYASDDLAADLLERNGHGAEAIEFLTVLTRAVPWKPVYRLRLAQAQLGDGTASGAAARAEAAGTLTALAADGHAEYELRVEAADLLRSAGLQATGVKLGSAELSLLARGKITSQEAQQPYFAAVRMAAAEQVHDPAQALPLLRQAISIRPEGFAGASGFSERELRLGLFRAEQATGHAAMALAAIQPLLSGPNAYTRPSLVPLVPTTGEGADPADSGGAEAEAGADPGEGAEPASAEDTEKADDPDQPPAPIGDPIKETLAELEAAAPLPLLEAAAEAEKGALARQVAEVEQQTGNPGEALPYLKLAAYLEKDAAARAELLRKAQKIQMEQWLETQNAPRRPVIQRELDQANLVRPMLTAAQLNPGPAGRLHPQEVAQ